MTAPRRCLSYSLGWGTLLCHSTHSHWLVILSTTPRNTPVTPSRRLTLRGTILGCAGTLQYTCYQNRSHWPWRLNWRRHKTHMWNMASLTSSLEERNRRGNQADHLRIFPVSMTNVEVAVSMKHRWRSRRFWSSRQVIPHVPRFGSWLPPCLDAHWGCH